MWKPGILSRTSGNYYRLDRKCPLRIPLMEGIWHFVVVRQDCSFVVKRDQRPRLMRGADEDALAFAARLGLYFFEREVLRVEAHGREISGEDSRLVSELFRLRPHLREAGWVADATRLMHPAWHRKLEHAIGYAAFRGRGFCCQVDVLERSGKLREMVLMDLRGKDPNEHAAPSVGIALDHQFDQVVQPGTTCVRLDESFANPYCPSIA